MSSLQQLLQFSNECLQIQVALQLYGAIFMCVLQLCHAIVIDGLKLDVCVITLQLMVRQVTFGPCTYTDPQSCKVPGCKNHLGVYPDYTPFLKVSAAQDKIACGPCVLPLHKL